MARRTVERVHGEAVTVRPMDRAEGPNSARATSTTRPAYEATACFYEDTVGRDRERQQPIVHQGNGGRLVNRSPQLVASIPLRDGSPLRTGDFMQRDAARWYEITEITPDGLGGAMVTLAVAAPIPGV